MRTIARNGHLGAVPNTARTSGVIVIFGDAGSLQHNSDSDERVEGEKLENSYESMEKQGFLS
jgi:hypothetical protein